MKMLKTSPSPFKKHQVKDMYDSSMMQEHYLKYFLPLLQVPRSYELTTR